MSSFDRIATFLDAARRRFLWVHVGAGLCAALGGAAAAWLLFALGAAATGPRPFWPAIAPTGILLAFGAGLAWFCVRPLLRLRTHRDVALAVGAHAPAVRSDLLSAVELRAELPRLVTEPRFSRALVLALADATAAAASHLDLRHVAPVRPLHRPLQALASLAGLYVLLALLVPSVLHRGALALGRDSALAAFASEEPIVSDITLTLNYPKYSGLAPKVIANTSGDISALRGTEVQVETRALLPSRAASCVLGTEEVRKVELKDNLLRLKFRVDRNSTYRFVLEPSGGASVREPIAHKIDLEPDHAPKVELFAPAEDLEVAGRKIIEVGYAAEDDYGVTQVSLLWKAGDGPEQRRLLREKIGTRSAQGRFDWDLNEVGLRPGMRVAYRIEAKDNDDVGGPNIGLSRTFYLRLTSAREKHEARIEEQAELLENMVRALGDRLEIPPEGSDDAAGSALDALGSAHGREESASATAARLGGTVVKDEAAPKELRPALAAMAERLGKLVRDEADPLADAQAKRRRGQLRSATLGRLREDSPRHVAELEGDVLKLDDLIGRQRLESLTALADETAAARDRLKQLLERYRKTRDPEAKKELEREMRELGQRLREMMQKLAQMQAKHEVPDEFLNAKLDQSALSDMERLEQMLQRGDLEAAAKELDRLSQALDDMRQALDSDLKGFRDSRFSAEEKAMSEALDKVADLEAAEKQIEQETGHLLAKQREEANRRIRGSVDELVKRELEKVARLERRAREVPPDPMTPYDQEELDRARRRIDDLHKMLDQGDLEQALEMAREAHGALKTVHDDARDELARQAMSAPMREDMAQAQRKLGEAEPLAKEVVQDLERALPSPQDLLSPEDRRRLRELGAKQSELRQRTEQLAKELEQRGKEAPGISEAAPPLRRAGGDMQRAEEHLRGTRAREAAGQEQQAEQKLADMRKQMQRQRRPSQGGQTGQELQTERIKIPGADEFQAPREFRQDILEAMKEAGKAPQHYREQVKKYYEELVK